jgi:hypothetical protein
MQQGPNSRMFAHPVSWHPCGSHGSRFCGAASYRLRALSRYSAAVLFTCLPYCAASPLPHSAQSPYPTVPEGFHLTIPPFIPSAISKWLTIAEAGLGKLVERRAVMSNVTRW